MKREKQARCAEAGTCWAHSPLGGKGKAGALSEVRALRDLAASLETTPQELALAWLLDLDPVVVPIPGATRTSSVDSGLRALRLKLDDEAAGRLGRALRTLPIPSIARRIARKVWRMFRG